MDGHDDAGGVRLREPSVTLDELLRGLLWPLLLRGPAMALRPERWLLGVATAVAVGLIGSISGIWAGSESSLTALVGQHLVTPIGDLVQATLPWNWHPTVFRTAINELVLGPARLLDADPWAVAGLGAPMLIVWAIGGIAISRSAACEVSLARVVPWPQALGFGMRRWVSGLASLAGPLLFIGVVHLVIAVGGAILLRWPVLDVAGALVHGLSIGAAILAVLVGLGYVLGWSMLIPALACEGTDALDAVQRVYAYVLGKPARLFVYLVIIGLVGIAAFTIATWVREMGVLMANGAAGQWAGERGAMVLGAASDAEGSAAAAIGVLGLWRALLDVLIAGFVVSYVYTAGTLVYLLCRRINDGQEIAELWTEDGR